MKKQKEDVEVLAAKAKLARQEKCVKAVNEVLQQHRCQMSVDVVIGSPTGTSIDASRTNSDYISGVTQWPISRSQD